LFKAEGQVSIPDRFCLEVDIEAPILASSLQLNSLSAISEMDAFNTLQGEINEHRPTIES
jgi:hypothetical protein